MLPPKSILICDDHSLFVSGIQEILTKHGYKVSTVSTSYECIENLKINQYSVFLCDLNIDIKTGFDIFEEAKSYLTNTNVFLLTAYYEEFLELKAKKMGFKGYLTKETSEQDFIYAIELNKKSPFYSTLKPKNKNILLENVTEFSTNKIRLSKQEKEIIKQIVKGKTSVEIGQELFISKSTVDTHRKNINRKLGLNSLGLLIKFAHENNITD